MRERPSIHSPRRFQSSPGPKAGCYGAGACHMISRGTFQSSPGPKAGCYSASASVTDRPTTFQSSPGPKAGCYPAQSQSIAVSMSFQSSPGPKAGCYEVTELLRHKLLKEFQSSPGPKAGCYVEAQVASDAALGVSILTRPEGRVLLPPAARLRAAGRCFNPHPARRPGATFPVRQERIVLLRVSILTRPEGRVLRFALFVRRGTASCRFLREPSNITVPGSLDIEAAQAHILSCSGNSVARTPACLGDTPGPRKGASPPLEPLRR